MREILFKAKRVDNGEWVEGNYISSCEGTFIQTNCVEHYCVPAVSCKKVDPETLCQFTGLCDKNGNKIWENGIIKYHFGEIYAPIKYGCYQNCFDSQKTEHIGFYVDQPDDKCLRKDLGYWIDMVDAVSVGNVFQEKSDE